VSRPPFDATEPPNGDFARYIEKLERQAAAAPVPAATTSAAPPPPQRRSNAPSAAFLAGRAAWWLIGAGAALILLAVLPDDPMIETPLPGIVLIGAGLAIRKHFAKNRNSG
jgi:hypothetical protein